MSNVSRTRCFITAIIALFLLLSASLVLTGCGNRDASSSSIVYEGIWKCSGVEYDGKNVSSEQLIEDGSYVTTATAVIAINSGEWAISTDCRREITEYKWSVNKGDVLFNLYDQVAFRLEPSDGKLVTSASGDGMRFVFEKVAEEDELTRVQFDGFSMEAPLEMSLQEPDVSTHTMFYLPTTDMYLAVFSDPAEGQTAETILRELQEKGYPSLQMVSADGIDMVLDTSMDFGDSHAVNLHFVSGGNKYTVVLDYNDANADVFGDWVTDYYKTIKLGGEGNAVFENSLLPPSIDAAESSKGGSSAATPGVNAKKPSANSIPDGAISWKDASSHIGEIVTVYGKVVDVDYESGANGAPTFMDIGASYPDTNRVTAVIWGENRSRFTPSPKALYEGKTICVTGEIYVYNGACNIEVESPSQIEVIQ